jgi:ribonuclease-3
VDFFRRLYNYYLSPEKELVHKLQPILGFTPVRLSIFKMAVYHRSMSQDVGLKAFNNERLEYLGDAILSTIVAEYLFQKYPSRDEGFLTKMRSKIVKRTTLNDIADKMGIDVILKDYSTGRLSNSMMGNALEALVGAIYIEFGYNKTKKYVINKILRSYLDIQMLEQQDDNHKSVLLEWSQKNNYEVSYRILSKIKQDKRDYFKVGVYVDNEEVAIAEDYNKKSAEQKASEKAIQKLKI